MSSPKALLAFLLGLALRSTGLAFDEKHPIDFLPGDVIAFCGGQTVVEFQENGYLETALASALRVPVRFRDLAWEGDTVFEQRRDFNFGSWPAQLRRSGATVLIAQFGKAESFAGEAGLARFSEALGKWIAASSENGRRIILLSPTPEFLAASTSPARRDRNAQIERYVEAMRKVSADRRIPFVDLFHPLAGKGRDYGSDDGIHLAASGHALIAQEAARQLHLEPVRMKIRSDGSLRSDRLEKVRQAVVAKNRLWFNYWRPMNWAFLNGDRIEQPSSRDHRDPKIRWFPAEVESLRPRIEALDGKISDLAAAVRK